MVVDLRCPEEVRPQETGLRFVLDVTVGDYVGFEGGGEELETLEGEGAGRAGVSYGDEALVVGHELEDCGDCDEGAAGGGDEFEDSGRTHPVTGRRGTFLGDLVNDSLLLEVVLPELPCFLEENAGGDVLFGDGAVPVEH